MFANPLKEHHARVEWTMLAALFCLMAIGAAFVFSAAAASDPGSRLYLKQMFFYGAGLGAAAVICLVPYHTISRFATVFYWCTSHRCGRPNQTRFPIRVNAARPRAIRNQ